MTSQQTAEAAAPSIVEQVATFATAVIDHMNSSYADALRIVAAAHGTDGVAVTAAEIVELTHESLTLRYTAAGAADAAVVTIADDAPVNDLGDIRLRALDIVAAARTRLGITELTSAEQEVQAIRALRTHITSVVAVEQLSPHFKQITFGGGDLATYRPTGGLDEFLYVLAPPAGRTQLTIDAAFSWDTYEEIPEGDRPVGASYTVRRGAVIVVSHDRAFLERSVSDVLVIDDAHPGRRIPGGFGEWQRRRVARAAAPAPNAKSVGAKPGGGTPAGGKPVSGPPPASRSVLSRQLREAEKELAALTRRRDSLVADLSAAGTDVDAITRLGTDIAVADTGIAAAEERWLVLAEQLEAAR